jgi:hypothetical protein
MASFRVTPSWCLLSGFDRPDVRFLAPFASETVGRGHSFWYQTCSTKLGNWSRCRRPVPFSRCSGPFAPFQSRAAGRGHTKDEDAFPLLRVANLFRREQSDLNRETKLAKVSPYPLGSSDFVSPRREHARNVLDEDEPRTRLDDDAPGRTPEVTLVEASLLAPCEAVRLARDAADEAVHASTP